MKSLIADFETIPGGFSIKALEHSITLHMWIGKSKIAMEIDPVSKRPMARVEIFSSDLRFRFDEIENWMHENLDIRRVSYRTADDEEQFNSLGSRAVWLITFEEESDATLFTMRWCGA